MHGTPTGDFWTSFDTFFIVNKQPIKLYYANKDTILEKILKNIKFFLIPKKIKILTFYKIFLIPQKNDQKNSTKNLGNFCEKIENINSLLVNCEKQPLIGRNYHPKNAI